MNMKPYFPSRIRPGIVRHWLLACAVVVLTPIVEAAVNQVPNSEFRGTAGFREDGAMSGTVNGAIPTLWRGFALNSAEITLEQVPLAADALAAGSPATNAVTLTIDSYGDAQGFDTSPNRFSIEDQREYRATVYIRSNNPDMSDQEVSIGVPIFDGSGTFTGRAPGTFLVTVSDEWTLVEGPVFMEAAGTSAEISFRLTESGVNNSIQIALPIIEGVALANQVPNPEFVGQAGAVIGDATGSVPDEWRGFAVDGSLADFAIEPVAANALYPGSPATRAVRMVVDQVSGGVGFDNTNTLLPVEEGRIYTGQFYVRSPVQSAIANIQIVMFDATSVLATRILPIEVGTQWNLVSTGSLVVPSGTVGAVIDLRPVETGTFLITQPQVLGPDELFANGFESPPPQPL